MTTAMTKRNNGQQPATFGSVVDSIFQNNLRRFFDDNFWETPGKVSGNSVPVNIRERDQHYELDVVAPGCRKEDFSIRMQDNMLTVSMEHKEENKQEDKESGWVRNEFIQQSFSRSFTLDDTVDSAKVEATYKDGILRIVLPKNEKAKQITRNIEVK